MAVPKQPAPHHAAQRGAALLLAMIVLALVTTVTAGMVWHQTRAVHVEGAERARAQAAWILTGALDWARLILREDNRNNRSRRNPYDGLDEPWATPLEEVRLSSFLAADQNNNTDNGPEAFISGSITDAQSRFNLRNLLDDKGAVVASQVLALQNLCDAVGLSGDTAARLAQALGSAPATASVRPQPGQASSGGVQALRPQRLSDLAWLGMEDDLLQTLEPWVDLLPVRTPVNVNTAPREVLVAALDGLDLGGAQRLVQARQRQPFETVAALKAQLSPDVKLDPARVSVTTAYFIVSGRLRLEERVLEERSLLVRRNNRVDVLRRERHSFALPSR